MFSESAVLNHEMYGSSLLQWAAAIAVVVVTYPLLLSLTGYLGKRCAPAAKASRNSFDDVFLCLVKGVTKPTIAIVALYLATFALDMPPAARQWPTTILILSLLFQAGLWGSSLADILVPTWIRGEAQDPSRSSAVGLLTFLAKFLIWTLVTLMLLDNAGVDVTALVAGLGIGGIAVALAVQNVLGDLLGSLSIILDKPFQVGDAIKVGDLTGTVERIGIKTTRLKSLSGEQLVFSNSDLLGSRIQNFKRLYERRVAFSIGVTYETPREQLEQIPGYIRRIVEAQPSVRFDRSHLKEFGASSILYETVYFMTVPDYTLFMDTHQRINLAIYDVFAEHSIEFAFPSQTLYLKRGAGRPDNALNEGDHS